MSAHAPPLALVFSASKVVMLEAWARRRTLPARVMERVQIVRWAANGVPSQEIAQRRGRAGCTGPTSPCADPAAPRSANSRMSGANRAHPGTGRQTPAPGTAPSECADQAGPTSLCGDRDPLQGIRQRVPRRWAMRRGRPLHPAQGGAQGQVTENLLDHRRLS